MTAKIPPPVPNLTQFALRFAVVSDILKSQPIFLQPKPGRAVVVGATIEIAQQKPGQTVEPACLGKLG